MNSMTESWTSNDRVRRNTRPESNARIDEQTRYNIERYRGESAGVIARRIDELNREWDIERVLEANASALAFSGVLLGATVDRKWLLLSGAVLGFLFLHATQGWCPPVPLLRARGVRTQGEIDEEKFALREMMGTSTRNV
jgi:hypothetical protein